ncbi:MAG: primosomal protein N' [Wenzhouxiangellaceae bacterium]|nr:primosomal protein N' [Wenzhouxiangellaceae bacterium]
MPPDATFVRVAVPAPVYRLFDYLPPPGSALPARGARVLVPFGRRRLVGVVVGHGAGARAGPASGSGVDQSRLRPIEQVLDDALVPSELLELLEWTTRYYAAPPGERVTHALPAPLRRNRPIPAIPPDWIELTDTGRTAALERAPRQAEARALLAEGPARRTDLRTAGIGSEVLRTMHERGLIAPCRPPAPPAAPGPDLNPDQRAALAAMLRARHRFEVLLLAGVTGSGKTEVYLQAARHAVRRGRQVLVLLPEIGLTPQFVRRIENRLGRRAWIYHSGLSGGERVATWTAARSGEAELLVGTRSAVFLPLARPGLIVVDEEHDGSFKQFDGMRYHARDVAVYRASRLGAPVVLGSATPSLESLHNADAGRYRMLLLPERAGSARLPHWQLVDPRGQAMHGGLSQAIVDRIGATLEAARQVLVYRNRRGFAPVLVCNECGWHADCERCSAHLTWHRGAARLMCHHCGHRRRVPQRCPSCRSPCLESLGAGTERIESVLASLFPDTTVVRIDRDAVRGRDDFENALATAARGEPCVLVGTQMLAKGHHLPGIGLAVMLDVDPLLFSADFRAPERMAQNIVQVAGRAGRGEAGDFLLQTRYPEHALIRKLAAGDYLESARMLLAERRDAGLPPATRLAMVRAESRDPAHAQAFLRSVRVGLSDPEIRVAGPVAAILQRRAGYWRFQLWLQADGPQPIARVMPALLARIEALPGASRVRWHVDVDPQEM